jgi:hypothetical protein
MRKAMLLAAIVAALGTISQPAEAHDRGLSFRHFSGHAGPKLRLRDRGPMSHQGFFGKPQPFMRRHFSDSATEVSCAGSVTGTLCSNSVMCFRSSLAASDMDTAKAASSLGSIARGKRGGGTTAALFSKTRLWGISGTSAIASRVPRPARVAGCTARRRQKLSSDGSSRWVFGMCQSC